MESNPYEPTSNTTPYAFGVHGCAWYLLTAILVTVVVGVLTRLADSPEHNLNAVAVVGIPIVVLPLVAFLVLFVAWIPKPALLRRGGVVGVWCSEFDLRRGVTVVSCLLAIWIGCWGALFFSALIAPARDLRSY